MQFLKMPTIFMKIFGSTLGYCNGLNLPLHNEITTGDIASVDDQLIDSEFVIKVTSAKKR